MKKRRGAPLKPRAVMIIIAVCGAVCLAGIGYVWAKTEVHALSRELKKLEVRRDELKRENAALEREYARMCTPGMLDQRVKALNLGLAAPQPDQIVRLTEPLVIPAPKQEWRVYAARTNIEESQ